MREGKKPTFAQNEALTAGRAVARRNQRERVAAKQAAAQRGAEFAAEQAAKDAEAKWFRGGAEVGQTVTGRDLMFGRTMTGVVVEKGSHHPSEGVPVFVAEDDMVWTFSRRSVAEFLGFDLDGEQP